MQQILNLYHSVPTSVWALIAAAISVSGIIQTLKHFFFNKLSASALVSLTTAASFLISALQWFTEQVHANPKLLGVHTMAILGASQLAYRFAIAPFYQLLLDGQAYRKGSTPTPSIAPATQVPAPGEAGF